MLPVNDVAGLALRHVVTRQVLGSTAPVASRSLHHGPVELVVERRNRCHVVTFHGRVNRAEVGMFVVMHGFRQVHRASVMRTGLRPVIGTMVVLVRMCVVLLEGVHGNRSVDGFMAHGSHSRLTHTRVLEVII